MQIITTDLESQPAVRSWLALAARPDGFTPSVPERIELVHRSNKTSVYRLPRVGLDAGGVIAKQCRRQGARVERDAYQILERLRCASIRYYGFVDEPGDEFCWLFLEDAGGERFDPKRPEQRQLAARWLARLHTTSSKLDGISRLPDRGPRHYLEHLRAGRETLRRGQTRRALSPGDRAVLDEVRRVLDHAESRWPDVVASSHDMPWALVHADFVKKNVGVRRRDAESEDLVLLAFDWEDSGWGLPAVDLGMADLDVYHTCVREYWPQVTRKTLERLALVGALLRGGTASVRWEAESLETGWLENVIGNMRIYAQRMAAAFEALGWKLRSP